MFGPAPYLSLFFPWPTYLPTCNFIALNSSSCVGYAYGSAICKPYVFFFVALRPNAGNGLLILEVSISHTTTHHSL